MQIVTESTGRILVTGGSGFLAGHLILRLLADGRAVRTTVRSPARAEHVRGVLERAGALTTGLEFALADLPAPDLFIRTGGDLRVSNFLLWQLAYTELWFTETLWPEFGAQELEQALQVYASRERRFGLTGEQIATAQDAPGEGHP